MLKHIRVFKYLILRLIVFTLRRYKYFIVFSISVRIFVKENGRGFERSDNLSSEIFYSCTRFYGLRKATKCQRTAGVDVEVVTATSLLKMTYGVITSIYTTIL